MTSILNMFFIDFQKYEGFCLGRVINDNLKGIQEMGGNTLYIQICNEHWHGNFPIPTGVGFSTPIGVLKGASIAICFDSQATNKIFDELKKWNEFYNKRIDRQDNSYIFTPDKRTCHLCSKDYRLGDKLLVVRKCDHIFHLTCLQKWRLRDKSMGDVLISLLKQETPEDDCPLSREHIS